MEVHSVSKYLCGHSDVIAGVIVGRREDLDKIIPNEHALMGGKMSPFEAWLVLRSLRTLHLRMRQHQEAAFLISEFLESHPKVEKVNFPGLRSFDQYELGKKQMTGYGSLFSIQLKTKELEEVKSFVNRLQLFKLGVSWGGHESLIYSPSISYAKELSPEKFAAMGINISLVRLSLGLENPQDLMDDLDQGLSKIK
jgi:cystathionine beta-lyase/cystathionine gamma-synthase